MKKSPSLNISKLSFPILFPVRRVHSEARLIPWEALSRINHGLMFL